MLMNSYNNNQKASIVLFLNFILCKFFIVNKNLNDNYHSGRPRDKQARKQLGYYVVDS